jgi:hypothetical protein
VMPFISLASSRKILVARIILKAKADYSYLLRFVSLRPNTASRW